MSAEAPSLHRHPNVKLYVRRPAPNALKVEIFAEERGIHLEIIDAASFERDQIWAMNPLGTVPILEIMPGRYISESLTICQFLDELAGGTRLFGANPHERAEIAMWERRAELRLFAPGMDYAHHTLPAFAGLLRQHPEWARDEAAKSSMMLGVMAERLDASPFLAGSRLSAADLTAYLGYRIFMGFGAVEPVESEGFRRWEMEVSARPCMTLLRPLIDRIEGRLDG